LASIHRASAWPAVQRLNDRRDGVGLISRRRAGQLSNPDLRQGLDNHSVDRRPGLVLNRHKPRLNPGQTDCLSVDLRADLSPAQPEHPAKFRGAQLVAENRLHLLEGKAELLQRNDAVQVRELSRR
jgi:hypothetical protein